jgi:hypothetical protein
MEIFQEEKCGSDEVFKQIRMSSNNIDNHTLETDKSFKESLKKSNFQLDREVDEILDTFSNRRKNESKVGFLKEGYSYFKEINPIDRYNFVIDRYNEEFNRLGSKILKRIPSNKPLRKLYDMYTWLSRLFLSFSIIVFYYFLLYIWKSKYQRKKEFNFNLNEDIHMIQRNTFRSTLFTYKKYLLSDHQEFYSNSYERKFDFWIILQNLIFIAISIYIVLLFLVLMLVPNIFFTTYLLYAYYIHKLNTNLVNDIFANMLMDDSLDMKGQLNDYIIVQPGLLRFFYGTSFIEKLDKLYSSRDKLLPQVFMIYGHLFKREYDIIGKALFRQIISVVGFIILTIYYYI